MTDEDALDLPLFAVDQYGEFIPGPNGLPQFVMSDGTLVEGNLDNPVSVADAEASAGVSIAPRTSHEFLSDIARTARPVFDSNGDLAPDSDDVAGNEDLATDMRGNFLEYDNELLDAHFIAGDGRVNENIGLTAVHHVFHQEHNRLVEHTKEVLLSNANNVDLGTTGDEDGAQAALDLLNGFLLQDVATFPTTEEEINNLVWDGDRLFQ